MGNSLYTENSKILTAMQGHIAAQADAAVREAMTRHYGWLAVTLGIEPPPIDVSQLGRYYTPQAIQAIVANPPFDADEQLRWAGITSAVDANGNAHWSEVTA